MKIKRLATFFVSLHLIAVGVCLAQLDISESTSTPTLTEKPQVHYSPFPQPDAGYVTDYANLLSDEEEKQIERWLWQIESKTRVEIIVMTIFRMEKLEPPSKNKI